MKKFYLILTALATAFSSHAGGLNFMIGDRTIEKGETVTFGEIESDGFGGWMIDPSLSVMSSESTTTGIVVAECTTGQKVQMCAGGTCMMNTSITKTGLKFVANQKFPLEFEYTDFMSETKDDIDKDITVNFTAEDGLGAATSMVLILNPSEGSVGVVFGDKPEVKFVGKSLVYKVNGTCTLSLHNILGVRAMQTTISGTGSISLTDLPKGIYVYSVQGATTLSGKISIP